MQIIRDMTTEELAQIGAKTIDIICDISNMDLEQKEEFLQRIPKDYKLENDMTIAKYRIWTEIRDRLVMDGCLGVGGNKSGQQRLDV